MIKKKILFFIISIYSNVIFSQISDLGRFTVNINKGCSPLKVEIIDENVVTQYGNYRLRGYRQTNNDQIHVALTLGEFSKTDSVLTRINSSVIDNDVTKILSGTNEKRYDKIFEKINKEGRGAVIFINQNQSPDDILKKLKSFNNKKDKPKIDFKDFGIGAQILHDLGISKINLLSNSEQINRVGLSGYGLTIKKRTKY